MLTQLDQKVSVLSAFMGLLMNYNALLMTTDDACPASSDLVHMH